MAAKTYVPGLRLALKLAHRYATRYNAQLSLILTSEQLTCLTSVIQALADCLALLGVGTTED